MRYLLAQLAFDVFAIEQLAKQHLILENCKMVENQRCGPMDFVSERKALEAGQIDFVVVPVF